VHSHYLHSASPIAKSALSSTVWTPMHPVFPDITCKVEPEHISFHAWLQKRRASESAMKLEFPAQVKKVNFCQKADFSGKESISSLIICRYFIEIVSMLLALLLSLISAWARNAKIGK
jgi:hypothetical protein